MLALTFALKFKLSHTFYRFHITLHTCAARKLRSFHIFTRTSVPAAKNAGWKIKSKPCDAPCHQNKQLFEPHWKYLRMALLSQHSTSSSVGWGWNNNTAQLRRKFQHRFHGECVSKRFIQKSTRYDSTPPISLTSLFRFNQLFEDRLTFTSQWS